MHGKWSYKTVVIYCESTRKDGVAVWTKGSVLAEAASYSKIQKMAQEKADLLGIPLLPDVRHNQVIA